MSRSGSTEKSSGGRGSVSEDEPDDGTAANEGWQDRAPNEDDRPRQRPELQYSKEALMELRSHPLANKRPTCLNDPWNEAIERWQGDRKRSETPTEEDNRRRVESSGNTEKRRSNDPRERVRKEQDGIVLSPQRRSFNSGCFVPTSQPQATASGRRPESPLSKGDSSNLILGRDMGHREISTTRRIGSGRIPARESSWEFRDPSWEIREAVWDQPNENLAPEHGSFRPGGGTGSGAMGRGADSDRNHRDRDREMDGRHDNRRRFGWDFDRERDRDRDRERDTDKDRFERRNDKSRLDRMDRHERMDDRLNRRNDRDDRYGRRRNDREEEPEWFSAGPTSQHDTIELRGFEDTPEDGSVLGRPKKGQTKLAKAGSRTTAASKKNSDAGNTSARTGTPPPGEVRKNSQDGKLEKGEKGDKSRQAGPLATSSPDTKEKKAKQQNNNTSLSEKKDDKDQMDVTEDSGHASNGTQELGRESTSTVINPSTKQMDLETLEEFLKNDTLSLLMNGGQSETAVGGSRFRQWFSRDSPTKDDHLRSVHDDINNMMNDVAEPSISIPIGSDSDSFFAPISPAANSLHQQHVQARFMKQQNQQTQQTQQQQHSAHGKTSVALLEMLQRGSGPSAGGPSGTLPGEVPSIRDLEATGKLHSVEELEARMRSKGEVSGGGVPTVREPRLADPAIAGLIPHAGPPPIVQHREEEMAAFQKLLAKVSGESGASTALPSSSNVPIRAQPIEFIQMLKRVHEPQVASEAPSAGSNNAIMNAFSGAPHSSLHSVGASVHPVTGQPQHPAQPQSQQQIQIPEDFLMKLLQVQQHQQQQQQQQQQQHQQRQRHQQQQQDMLSKLMGNTRVSQLHQQGRRLGSMQQQSNQFGMQSASRSPLPPEVQTLVATSSLNQDLLQRAEAQAIITGLNQGEITTQHLVQQLQNPAITRTHQELLLSILKTHQKNNVFPPYTGNPRSNSPLIGMKQTVQEQCQAKCQAQSQVQVQMFTDTSLQQMLLQQQHQQQSQLRIPSPLNVVQRVPSPRDLAIRAQNIMQNALIKKKVEEQKENYRKRQEEQRSLSPNVGPSNFNNNVNKNDMKHHMSSPSPLAFTPTSVLKKMNAEKEGDQKIGGMPGGISFNDLQQMQQGSRQPSLQLTPSQVQQQQQRLPPNWNANKAPHPQGRPILKSSSNFSYGGSDGFLSQNSLSQGQTQSATQLRGLPQQQVQYPPRSKMTLSTPPPNMAQQPPQFNMNMMQGRSSVGQTNSRAMQAHLSSMQQPPPQQQHHSATSSLQQMLLGSSYSQNHGLSHARKTGLAHGGSGDLSTSPTSNQLARWFSPEMLARARSTPAVPAQGMLSVEDLERLQQAVHN